MSGQTTGERGCGLWHTPRQGKTTDEEEETWMKRKNRGDVSTPPLTLAVKMWRSPSANEPGITPERLEPIEGGELGGMNRHFDKHTGRMAQIGLTQQVALRQWPTPTGTERSGINPNTGKGEGLSKTVKNWPTPNCDDLNNATRASGVYRSLTREATQAGILSGQLNPDWVEWLMLWPIGWSSLKPMTELVWLSPRIDPADMEEAVLLPTPTSKDNQHCPSMMSRGVGCRNLREKREGINTGPIPRVATGIKDRVNRLKALGNGQVSLCAATAFRILAGQ